MAYRNGRSRRKLARLEIGSMKASFFHILHHIYFSFLFRCDSRIDSLASARIEGRFELRSAVAEGSI
jgi:hypothetical protein